MYLEGAAVTYYTCQPSHYIGICQLIQYCEGYHNHDPSWSPTSGGNRYM